MHHHHHNNSDESSALLIPTLASSSSSLLRNRIESKLNEILLNETSSNYSYYQVQRKIKTLARTWNDSILGIPILIQIGYNNHNNQHPRQSNNNGNNREDDDTKTVRRWKYINQ